MRQLKITKQITDRQTDSINRYFLDIGKYETLTVEEEVELTGRIRKGDIQALEKLTTANLRFVVSVAKQYQNQGLSLPDLINEGNVGLVKAATKFDETRGFKFISYAVWWIRQAIMQAIAEQSRIVRLPLNKISAINKASKAMLSLEQEYQREPTDEEIAEQMELSTSDVNTLQDIKRKHISFDAPIGYYEEDSDNLYSISNINNLPMTDARLHNESLKTEINMFLSCLSKREADVIRLYYGLNECMAITLEEIGAKLGLSRERVRQVKSSAIHKLKNNSRKIILKKFL